MSAVTTMPAATKINKSKHRTTDVEEPATVMPSNVEEAQQSATEQDDGDISTTETPPSKKRKRDVAPVSELEIDVSLPEPPSKKALRKAKKQKTTSSSSTTSKPVSEGTHDKTDDEDDVIPKPSGSDVRSSYGIWIGNLPFTTTKPILRSFLTASESGSTITDAQITRVHMPAPANAAATKTQLKPLNKGFAYVDFTSKEALDGAMALSETLMGGRRVLIKDAKSFEGRPQKAAGEASADGEASKDGSKKGNSNAMKPTKRVFVGNLGFDVTKEDLKDHYAKCGDVVDIHMATFEDSGKCKGFAWVTFDTLEAAEAAVRGWLKIPEPDEDSEDSEEESKDDGGVALDGEVNADDAGAAATVSATRPTAQKPKKQNMRKWFVNRLFGRPLRCEYAEDASSRYKKRFGKESNVARQRPDAAGIEEMQGGAQETKSAPDATRRKKTTKSTQDIQPGAPTDRNKRRGKVAGVPDVSYRTGGIVESEGTKVTFD